MGLAKITNYKGYQITTLVEPIYRPTSGFVGHVTVSLDGAHIVADTTAAKSNFNYAEAAATNLGHEMVEILLSPLEPNPK